MLQEIRFWDIFDGDWRFALSLRYCAQENDRECGDLQMFCERYRARRGHYPEAVPADKLFRTRENLRYCAEHGIRLSGPRLGRPAKIVNPEILKQQLIDNSARNAIEGKFGQCKRRFGLGRVMARRRDCSETAIAITFPAANLIRWLWNTETFFALPIPAAIFHSAGTAHHAVLAKCSMIPSGSADPRYL